jgi:hypothetical protein
MGKERKRMGTNLFFTLSIDHLRSNQTKLPNAEKRTDTHTHTRTHAHARARTINRSRERKAGNEIDVILIRINRFWCGIKKTRRKPKADETTEHTLDVKNKKAKAGEKKYDYLSKN